MATSNPNKKSNGSLLALGASLLAVTGGAGATATFGLANYLVSQITRSTTPTVGESYTFSPYEFEAEYEDVLFPTANGRMLTGWYLWHENERRVVVVAHGHNGRKEDMLGITTFLWKAGFNVLAFDFRAHGYERKREEVRTLGSRELEDFQAAVEFVYNRFAETGQGEPMVGALGGSLGAAVTLVAAARDPRIRAVWADSSFSSRKDVVAYNWQKQFHLPTYPVLELTEWLFLYRTGHTLSDFSPKQEVAKIAPRPVYFLHSECDQIIPMSHSQALYEASPGPKSLWIENGGYHCGIYFKNRSEYRRRLIRFFEEALEGLLAESLCQELVHS